MGGSSWSDDHYTSRVADRTARSVPTFAHHAKASVDPTVVKLHADLNIKGKIRESRDSAAHPESVAVAVMFDVTGSMRDIPQQLQKKLPQLMGLLLRNNYLEHPQVLFGAIGDYHSDHVPLQVGQFESGIEMEDDMTKFFLEGGGGGQNTESYQNAFYFFGRKTSCDCFEKRGKKGYLFLIGDEMPYATSSRQEILDIFGDNVEADQKIDDMLAACLEKWEVFFIIPTGASNGRDTTISNRWKQLLGERVIMIDNPDAVCETIGTTIGLVEGSTDMGRVHDDLAKAGASTAIATTVAKAVSGVGNGTALAKAGSGNLPEVAAPSGKTSRL